MTKFDFNRQLYQVSQKKMSVSEIGALLTKGHFFWDTLYKFKNRIYNIIIFHDTLCGELSDGDI